MPDDDDDDDDDEAGPPRRTNSVYAYVANDATPDRAVILKKGAAVFKLHEVKTDDDRGSAWR